MATTRERLEQKDRPGKKGQKILERAKIKREEVKRWMRDLYE